MNNSHVFRAMVGVLYVLSMSLVTAWPAQAVTSAQYQDKLDEINQLKGQIKDTQNQENTLANQISQMDNQIKLNELEVADTQGQIQSTQDLLAQVNGNIDDLTDKLGRLDSNITHLQQVADDRIREAYKKSRTPELGAIVAANNFKSAIINLEYVKDLAAEDAKLLDQINANRKDYHAQMDSLTQLKTQKETLKSQLEDKQQLVLVQQKELNDTKAGRAALLDKTKGDESTYQRLLAQAQAEAASMAAAMSTGQTFYVHRGDVIALEGDTGCATGPHLHFGYRRVNLGTYIGSGITDGHWIDPEPYINNGTLGKPIDAYPGAISQHFGQNLVSGVYDSNGHPAVDIAGPYGAPIYAAQSGWAVRMTDNGCVLGGVHTDHGKGIIITGDDGTQTLYWHIQ